MTAGYSGTPLAKKLGFKPGLRVAAIGAPANYTTLLAPLPAGVDVGTRVGKTTDIVHLFTTSKAELATKLESWLKLLPADAAIWVSWPKKAGKVRTDVTEDTIRAVALPMGLDVIKVCAIDETWSGLKLVVSREIRRPSGVISIST